MMMGAPQPDMSPIRAAIRPPIKTVALPLTIGVGGCGPASGGIEQAWLSPITAAGMPPIKTVATPGPTITPGCPVGSPTRAANGISLLLLIQLNRETRHGAWACRSDGNLRRRHIYLGGIHLDGGRFERNLVDSGNLDGLCLVIERDGHCARQISHLDFRGIERYFLLRAGRNLD